jgi:hypothetical protein
MVGPPPPPNLAKPPVHELLFVEVIRTESAVTDPLLAAGPIATTQSPTARSLELADCVVMTVVPLDVVSFRLCVFGGVNFFEPLEPFELFRGKFAGDNVMPDTDSVDPLTAVTFPEAMAKLPNRLRMAPPGFFGGLPLPLRPAKPPPEPVRNWKLPPGARVGPLLDGKPRPCVHDPVALAGVTLMFCTAMVVLDVLDGVPVAFTQLPTVMELTASETVLENCVVAVQPTVVWPVLGFCTSMVEPAMAATLPEAGMGAFVGAAAPAAEATVVAATRAVAPVPRHRAQRRCAVLPLVGVCMWKSLISVSLPLLVLIEWCLIRYGARRWERAQRHGSPGRPRRARQWPTR